jgi:hypothetical protein
VRRYDNAMLMFLLRALKPEVYGARVHVPAPAAAAPPAQPKVEVAFADSAQAGGQAGASSTARSPPGALLPSWRPMPWSRPK